MTTQIVTIALNRLDRDPLNVRRSYSGDGIAALAASIRADGYTLLQNLVVRKGTKGRYYVTAGGRRLAALNSLAEAGEIRKTLPVECRLRDDDDATAVSLTENLLKEDMHPADAFEAFNAMALQGRSVAAIAARFGTTETMVRRRLALARVAPVLLQLYRDGQMEFEQLSAFTVSDDHARQEEVWNSLPGYHRDADAIREALSDDGVRGTDKRVRFIGGIEAFEAAGGAVRRDLFDEKGGGYVFDCALLERLVADRLEAHAATVKAEGWRWVECAAAVPRDAHRMTRCYPEEVPLSKKDRKEYDRLTKEHGALEQLIEAGEGDDRARARAETIDRRLDELRARGEAYSAADIARGGVFVTLGYDGEVSIERGFVRPEDEPAAKGKGVVADGEPPQADAGKPSLPAALVEDLTAQKTAALRVELANNPRVALAAVVHAMLLSVGYHYTSVASALDISLSSADLDGSLKQADQCKALAAMAELRKAGGRQIPRNPARLWDWCLEQPQEAMLSLLALAAAQSVNVVQKPHDRRERAINHGDMLGRALDADMTRWFVPTAANYFSHVSRAAIEAAVSEARGEEAAMQVKAASKKAEAAALAERLVAGSGWLPEPLRLAGPVDPDDFEDYGDEDNAGELDGEFDDTAG